MRIGILGAVSARRTDDAAELAPAGSRLRGLLARLALDPGQPVGTSVLVDALWGDRPPDTVANALQSLVSRLRRTLGAELVRTVPGGYRLDVSPDGVDALRFATLRRAAADEADPQRACELLTDALALWRGPALADVRDLPFAEPAAARLTGARADAVEELAGRGRDAGDPGVGLTWLTELLDEQPLRESAAVALARGLLAGGRQADALGVLDRTRDALAATLGVDPGPALTATRMAALRGEHELLTPASGTRGRPAAPAATEPARSDPARPRTAHGASAPAARNGTAPTRTGPASPHGTAPPTPAGAAPARPNGSATHRDPATPGGTAAATRDTAPATTDDPVAGGTAAPPVGTRPRRAPALTTFVGRDADVVRLRELIASSRLVTVIGPGGAGKTRLCGELVAPFRGPVAIAELAPLTGDEQLPLALLHAVGGPELVLRDGHADTTERLCTVLAGRELLLVLDNCEHLIGAVAGLAETLLGAAPRLRILATSREPLGIPGEILHPLGALAAEHAQRLFVDRAAAVRPGFAATGDDAAVVAEICRRLDGQPLPIELAAARVRTLSPAEIAHRLDDRFRLLTSGARTALPRHQTLRAVVDWSWDLLSAAERLLVARMGVFAGPVDADALDQVCGAGGDLLDVLAAVVDKSLVIASASPDGGPTRYLMLETIREYAAARLTESGERDALVGAHARWALALAERAEPELRTPGQLVALGRLRRNEDEITLALRRAVGTGDVELAHRLLAAMSWSWMVRGELVSAERWAAEVWSLAAPEPGPAAALNHAFHGLLRVARGDLDGGSRELDALLAMQRSLPRPWHPAVALAGPIRQAFSRDDDSGLVDLMENAQEPWMQGAAAQMLATVAENEGDLERQRSALRVAHARFAELGDRYGLGMSVFSLGELEDLAGDADAARSAFVEAVALATELGNHDDLPQFRLRLADLAARSGDLDEAEVQLGEALAARRDHDDGTWTTFITFTQADIARRSGDAAGAGALLDTAEDDTEATLPMAGGPQRSAILLATRAAVQLDLGRPDTAREQLDRAAALSVTSADGPVIGRIAEGSARWAIAAGAPERAAELLGVAITRRGVLDRGDPEVLATLAAVHAALGDEGADAAIARGRSLPRDHPPGPTPPG